MHAVPCTQGIVALHAPVAGEGGWHVLFPAQSRFPPQSAVVMHDCPVVIASSTQLPQLAPPGSLQYPVPHCAS
jgi:hypothetical protein